MSELFARAALLSRRALASGHLQPQATEVTLVHQDGLDFVLRTAKRPPAKPDNLDGKPKGDPFGPPEPELTLGPAGSEHLWLLNKFNVLDIHLLLITRDFQPQDAELTLADFAAFWPQVQQTDGLGFYNGGRDAGASQPHRHFQLVPRAMAPELTALPLDFSHPEHRARLAFRHHYRHLHGDETPEQLFAAWQQARDALGLERESPFNLLLLRQGLMVIPRKQKGLAGLEVNALGFAGSFFAHDQAQKAQLLATGFLPLLHGVALGA
ncbi:DUF4922 domain-containing protein [Gallaecimonas sp. GXIMD4217]|uniref:DUF4922 domain-containing protein n=1 Tax=Gallaecimonas sp. GXIMD4217 TaxID=3131927 RepID=UPI00311ADEBB